MLNILQYILNYPIKNYGGKSIYGGGGKCSTFISSRMRIMKRHWLQCNCVECIEEGFIKSSVYVQFKIHLPTVKRSIKRVTHL